MKVLLFSIEEILYIFCELSFKKSSLAGNTRTKIVVVPRRTRLVYNNCRPGRLSNFRASHRACRFAEIPP